MLISTFIFLFFLLLTYAIFLMASRKSDARHERLQQRVAEALREIQNARDDVQIARKDSIGGSASVNRLLSGLDFIRKLDQMIRQADIHITVSRLLTFCFLAGIMGALAAFTIFNLIPVVIIFFLAGAVPILHVSLKRKKRLQKFNAQLPDTLDLLSRSLAVGHAFSESMHQVAAEMPDPIAGEFRITFEEQKLGLSTK